MAEDVPFISEADLEAFLGVPVLTDLMLAIALDSACDAVRSFLGQRVNRVDDDVVYLDGSGRDSIRLPERPVRGITEVQEDGTVVEAGTYPDQDWMFDSDTGLIVRQTQRWRAGRRNIKVTYDHGWDVVAPFDRVVPADLRMIALVLARRIYKAVSNSSTPLGALKSESIGAYEYVLADLPADVNKAVASAGVLTGEEEGVLWKYRVLGVASGSRS